MEYKVCLAPVYLKLLILPPQSSVGTTGVCYQTLHSVALDHRFDRKEKFCGFYEAFLTITIMTLGLRINAEDRCLVYVYSQLYIQKA